MRQIEFEIAKQNLDKLKEQKSFQGKQTMNLVCLIHYQTCKRWLEWLKGKFGGLLGYTMGSSFSDDKKKDDLREAIKFYESQGIK